VLESLTKQDLLRLADVADLEGRSSMNKPELVGALAKQHISLADLTKQELLAVGEERGADVKTSMTKTELIAALAGSSSR
jgi:hypothetical protein